ncbi:MAG TPA: fibronectin type III domain-containing protein [Candidatus Limnocylindria bacterium]|nr:fibronectin type III domain-containing protein [Candidatus Limnocylindria bacterium]
MRKFLAAAACAALLMGLLPAVSPPARMVTGGSLDVDRPQAFVGDTLRFRAYGYTDVTAALTRVFTPYVEGIETGENYTVPSDSFAYQPRAWGYLNMKLTLYDALTASFFYSMPVIVSPRPAPKGVSVTALGASSLRVAWNAVPGATGYEVYRAPRPAGTYTLAGKPSAPAWTDTGLSPGVQYTYQIRSTNRITVPVSAGSVISGLLSDPAAGVPLATPVITGAEATGVDRIRLTIAPVAGATGYQIYVSSAPGGTYRLLRATTASALTVTGLTPGTAYYFKARAYHRIYTTNYYGPMSGYKGAKTLALGTASITSATPTGKDRVKLAISPAAGAGGYEVYVSTAAGGPYTLALATTSAGPTVTGLKPDTAYFFKARAYRRIYTMTYYGPLSGYRAARTLK